MIRTVGAKYFQKLSELLVFEIHFTSAAGYLGELVCFGVGATGAACAFLASSDRVHKNVAKRNAYLHNKISYKKLQNYSHVVSGKRVETQTRSS